MLRLQYKLLAIDIDDTLLPRKKPLSKANIEAIHRAERAGAYVVLATGRGYLGSLPVLRALGMDDDRFVINYGGAMINRASDGKPVVTHTLDSSVVVEVLALAAQMGLHAHLYQGDEIVYGEAHEYASAYSAHLNLPSRIEPDILNMEWSGVPKVLIITEPERTEELIPFFAERMRGKCAVSGSSPGFIEFNKIGASKGAALADIAEMLGVDRGDVAAIGDNTLDSEMIEWAGLGACVENGSPAVKDIAGVVVPACEKDGVAVFINRFVFSRY